MNITVKEMVEVYLRDNGFDGLCSMDCGCRLGDLMPCDEVNPDCEAAYEVLGEPEEPGDFFMASKKPGPVGHEECDELDGGK